MYESIIGAGWILWVHGDGNYFNVNDLKKDLFIVDKAIKS